MNSIIKKTKSKYNNEYNDEENEHKNENSNNYKQKNKRVSKQVQFTCVEFIPMKNFCFIQNHYAVIINIMMRIVTIETIILLQ